MLEYPSEPTPAPAPAPASAPAPAPAPARPRGSSRGIIALYAVAGLIAVGGVAFAAGRLTAPVAAATTRGNLARAAFGADSSFAPGAGRFGVGAVGAFGGEAGIRGTVQSINGTTLTLQSASGQAITIDLTGSTTYHRQAAASATDIQPGSTVQVQLQFNRAALGATPSGAPAGNAGNGAAPLASGATRTFTASDVTLVTP